MFVYLSLTPWILAFILLLIYKKKINENTSWSIFAIFITILITFLTKPELLKTPILFWIVFIIGIIVFFWVYQLCKRAKPSIISSLKTLGLWLIEEYFKKGKESNPISFVLEVLYG